MPAPLWFDPTGEELGSPGIVIDMFDGEALVSVGAQVRPERAAASSRRGWPRSAARWRRSRLDEAPACLEVPASWDDYIDARIQYWVDAETPARRS